MANDNLQNALTDAGLTVEEFAVIVRVDTKSVQRWLAGTSIPHSRRRTTIARALDLPAHQLWPEQTPQSATSAARLAPGTAAGVEVSGTWGYADDPGAPDPAAFITTTDGPIDLLENERGIQLTRELADLLVEQAAGGRPVRLLTNAAKPRLLGPLIAQDLIEVRFLDDRAEHSLLRVGEEMLLCITLDAQDDQPPALLTLHRTVDGGLFDRLTDDLDLLCNDSHQILTSPDQLDAHLTDDDDYEDEDQNAALTGFPGPSARPGPERAPADRPNDRPPPTEIEKPERRWPRRPQ